MILEWWEDGQVDIGYAADDPADLWENISPMRPEDFGSGAVVRRDVTGAFGMEALVTAWQDAGLLEEGADGCG